VSLYADAVDLLSRWTAPSETQETLRSAYVDHLLAHPDGLGRDCYPDHVTASALVVSPDRDRVLLTLHRKARQWFQFGGHLEDADATLAGGALRVATEESGLEGLLVQAEPLHLDRHEVPFCDPRGGVRHLDVRFLAVADAAEPPAVSEESVDVRWWPVDALPSEEPGLHELVRLARARP
jgi:ADP-ribose pyrophosphatase YjhB (NUDIX family)